MKLAIGNSQGHHHHVQVLTISRKRTFLHLVKYPLSLVLHQLTPSFCQRTEIGAISSGSTSKIVTFKEKENYWSKLFPGSSNAACAWISTKLLTRRNTCLLWTWILSAGLNQAFCQDKICHLCCQAFNQDWWNLFLPLHALSFSAHSAILFGTKFAISQLSQSQFISLESWNSFFIDRTLHLELMWNHRTR